VGDCGSLDDLLPDALSNLPIDEFGQGLADELRPILQVAPTYDEVDLHHQVIIDSGDKLRHASSVPFCIAIRYAQLSGYRARHGALDRVWDGETSADVGAAVG
jgi:hypothetical protein